MTTKRDPASWPADFGQGRYDGAHCATDIGADDDEATLGDGAGVLLWPMAVIAACGAWALYAFMTAPL